MKWDIPLIAILKLTFVALNVLIFSYLIFPLPAAGSL